MISFMQVDNLSKRFGERLLFENISFGIAKNQKTALIAPNGKGKSTLLRIIAGEESPDTGSVIFRNDITVGYLEQDPRLDLDAPVIEEVFNTNTPVLRLIKEYEQAVAANDTDALATLIPKVDALNAWNLENDIKQILSKLKINHYGQPIRELSGGQRKRVGLAKVLIKNPDFLILDEPTNHLDTDMIEWLEDYLHDTQTTLLMVTHDRYFLDRVCDNIIELDDYGLYTYAGNYSYYLEKRAERVEAANAAVDKARNLLRVEQEWMRRMPQARGHKARYRVDNFYRLKDAAARRPEEKRLELDIKGQRLGSKILELHHVSKSYEGRCLIRDFSYKFIRGEKIGIIGRNGIGKSTFLDIVTRAIEPDSGAIDIGETVVYGYYRQAGISFRPDDRPIDIVREIAERVDLGNGRVMSASQFLEYFLFPDKLQYTPVAKLSGGERRRLYLLTVLMANPNFLVLDEPTNDLDIMTLNVLEDYLRSFAGCLLVVSHDRFFIDKIVDHVFAFEGDGAIRDFPGNYTQYADKREEEERLARSAERAAAPAPAPKPRATQEAPKPRRLSFKEQQELRQLEADIDALTAERATLEADLSSGSLTPDRLMAASRRHGEITALLDEKETRWLELSDL